MPLSRIIVFFVSATFLAGCETTETRVAFDHSKATQGQMLKDRYACIQQSMGFVQGSTMVVNGGFGSAQSEGKSAVNGPVFNNCMAIHGYERNNETGRLVVPPSLVVYSYE